MTSLNSVVLLGLIPFKGFIWVTDTATTLKKFRENRRKTIFGVGEH